MAGGIMKSGMEGKGREGLTCNEIPFHSFGKEKKRMEWKGSVRDALHLEARPICYQNPAM